MDIISVIRDEEERDLFFIQEELREMEKETYENIKGYLESQQDIAYDRLRDVPVGSPKEIGWYQHITLADIALHLARIAEALEKISKRLEES